jgi:hypothetical protein
MSQPPGNSPQPGEPQDTPAPQAPPVADGPRADPTAAPPPPSAPPATAPPPPSAPPAALPTPPPAWQPPTGEPAPPAYQPGQPYPAQYQPTQYQPAHPGYPAAAPPRRRGLLITSIVLSVALVLCGAGGTAAYFVVKKVGGSGKASPTAAVEGFLGAVFTDHDVEAANKFVCSESRNKTALSKKINDLRSYEQKYKAPRYTWPEPTVDSKKSDTATLTVPVTITTDDDRVATKKLRFITVNESGWWVCEVSDAR